MARRRCTGGRIHVPAVEGLRKLRVGLRRTCRCVVAEFGGSRRRSGRCASLRFHQLFGGTNNRGCITGPATDRFNVRTHRGVGNMSAIPRHQVLYTVHGRQGYMERVFRVRSRDSVPPDQAVCEVFGLDGRRQQSKAGESFQPFSGGLLVARRTFLQDELRGDEIKPFRRRLPPLACRVLATGNGNISAAAGGEVPDHRGFDVDGCAHGHQSTGEKHDASPTVLPPSRPTSHKTPPLAPTRVLWRTLPAGGNAAGRRRPWST